MVSLRELNKYILEQVKGGSFDKDIAIQLLKDLNNKQDNKNVEFAVIGIGCRFPDANTHSEFWENLINGRNSIKDFPANRIADSVAMLGAEHKITSNSFFKAGYLDGIDKFDAEYFKIPPKVARQMDPYQRVFLEVLVESIEDAGYSRKQFYGSNTGVFVGTDHTHKFQASYLKAIKQPDFSAMTGSWSGLLSSRASYTFNFTGPSMVIDTACSSGMAALSVACQNIKDGQCEQAIVGGINLFVLPKKDEGQMDLEDIESKGNEVRTFDKFADGTAWGEAVCAILIKPLDKALADKDSIYGVIKGIAVNNDGASNGISAPNAKAQEEVLIKAWKNANIDPETISYIEAHGTATELGDPIEIKGLNNAFLRFTNKKQFCGIGSVKTNMGHAVGAAGLVSFIKVLLSLKNKQIPPSINFETPNAYIDFCNSPLFVTNKNQKWETEEGTPRRAGINSFSINGTNCHVILEESPLSKAEMSPSKKSIFVLSARNKDLLVESLKKYSIFFTKNSSVDFQDFCYTVATGREHQQIRLAAEIESLETIIQIIKRLTKLGENVFAADTIESLYKEGIYISSAVTKLSGEQQRILDKKATDSMLDFVNSKHTDSKFLQQTCNAYINGANIKWEIFYTPSSYNRLNMPASPFIQERIWVSSEKNSGENVIINGKESDKLSATEQLIAKVWAGVLQFSQLNISDNLFALGGDSVLAMQIVNVVNKELDIDCNISALLKHPTIESYADFLDSNYLQKGSVGSHKKRQTITPVVNRSLYPLSSAQTRMFFSWKMDPNSVTYNITGGVIIKQAVDKIAMQQAVEKLINNHESLRTTFVLEKGLPMQMVHNNISFQINISLVSESLYFNADKTANRDALNNLMQSFVKPFDLSNSPLFRVNLIQFNDNKYFLVLDFHHIISDGTSMGIFVRELSTILQGDDINAGSIQYKDYAVWQSEIFINEGRAACENYWLNSFEGDLSTAGFPTDYTRPKIQSFKGAKYKFEIGKETKSSMQEMVVRTGATYNMILLAAINTLVFKYTGQEDVIIGTPASGRSRAEIEGIIGMFVNILPMRNKPSVSKKFEQLLDEVRLNALDAYDHQDYQFEDLVEKLALDRQSGRNPLFDIMFQMQIEDQGFDLIEKQGLQFIDFETGTAKFDLMLTFREKKESISAELEYKTDLYNISTIENICNHLINILEEVSKNSELTLGNINILSADEKTQILDEFNQSATNYPKEKSLVQLFESVSEKYPNNTAVITGNQAVNYSSLNAQANQLAHKLIGEGVLPGSRIGLLLNRSTEMHAAIFGVLKTGAAYVPLDSDMPSERLNTIIKDSNIMFLVCHKELADKLNVEVPLIDINASDIGTQNENNPDVMINAKSPAYIIYTSGSTGKPKGTVICHQSVSRVVMDTNYIHISASDKILQLSNYSFDGSVFDIFGALLNGAELVLVKKEEILDIKKLASIISDKEVSIFFVTTALFNLLVSEKLTELTHVKKILFGGELVSVPHVEKALKQLGSDTLIHVYGPTESTVFASYYPINAIDNKLGTIPIGYPLANTKLYILDKYLKPLPVGVPGDIYIAGDGLSLGYLNADELTEEKFINNPFSSESKLYKTGDIGKWLPDGAVVFIGRSDHQVKIRGFRIELGEIEQCISTLETVKEVLVCVKEDENMAKYLCAYYVTNNNSPLSSVQLREYIGSKLPDFMVPARCLQLDKFPLNKNGKIDRTLLPEPVIETNTNNYEAPGNKIEEKLTDIWHEVLSIQKDNSKQIGVNDNFFELGGQSLKVVAMGSDIANTFNIEVPIQLIFEKPTIKHIANYIIDNIAIGNTPKKQLPEIEKLSYSEYFEVSASQKRLYALNKFNEDSTAYNMPGAFWVEANLDESKLNDVFNQIIERHEALRTNFCIINGNTVQKIHQRINWQLKIEYINSLSNNDLISNLIKDFIRPFNLDIDSLIRVKLIKEKSDNIQKCILLFDMHHIISDGMSMQIMIEEITNLYAEKVLPNVKYQYKDFAAYQNKLHSSNSLETQKEYWLKELAGELPVLNLPTDFPRPKVQSLQGNRLNYLIDKQLFIQLEKRAKESGLTMQMLLLAAYKILLAKYTGQSDIIVGVPSSGRMRNELYGIIGMFVNSLCLRSYPQSNKSISNYFNEIKQLSVNAYENQDYQIDKLVEELSRPRDTSRNPLFDTMFILQSHKDFQLNPYEYVHPTSKFDLMFEAWETANGLSLDIEYCTELYKPQTIDGLFKHYRHILEQIVAIHPSEAIKNIQIITLEEQLRIVNEFNNTKREYPYQSGIAELFEEQVALHPDKKALVSENASYTYSQLSNWANNIALSLQEAGATLESKVALLTGRTTEMIAGILGILKANAAYIPIDPDYPMDRKEYMLQDASVDILLTIPELKDNINFTGTKIVIDQSTAKEKCKGSLPLLAKGNNLAYIMYTSGSTGRPKGVMIEQQSVARLVKNTNFLQLTQNDTLLLTGAPVFDATTFEIWGSLLNGGCLCVVSEETILNASLLKEAIMKYGVSSMWLTAPLFNQLIDSNEKTFTTLKHLIVGGDVLSPQHINKALRANKELVIINGYGPTENTTFSNCFPIDKEYNKNIPIGKPIANSTAYIFNDELMLLPVGIEGELYLGGDGLARGYLNNDALTAEKFISNPLNLSERLYRTGDRAKWLLDGTVDFMGRKDLQVKIRGFRIELPEIERALTDFSDIQEVMVTTYAESNGNKSLCAYYVSKSTKKIEVEEIRMFLASHLPSYMIPSYYVHLDKFPLNQNGKIKKDELPLPVAQKSEFAAPRNQTEIHITQSWMEVLVVEEIGIDDNFFFLGGDSIKAIQVSSKLRENNLKLNVSDLFQYPTIRELSNFVRAYTFNAEQGIVCGAYKPLPVQKWFFENFKMHPHHFNQGVTIKTKEPFDENNLNLALTALVLHHDALRTSPSDGVILITDNKEHTHTLVSVYAEDDTEINKTIEKYAIDIQHKVNLSCSPILNLLLIKTKSDHYLSIFVHHLAIDGISWRVFLDDFFSSYAQAQSGKEISLPNKTNSVIDWSKNVYALAETQKYINRELAFWSKMLPETDLQSLEIKEKLKALNRQNTKNISISFDTDLTHRLVYEVNKAYNTDVNEVLLCAFDISLAKTIGNKPYPIMLEAHGREEMFQGVDVSRTLGWFTTLYPFILNTVETNKSKNLTNIIWAPDDQINKDISEETEDISLKLISIKDRMRKIPNKGFGFGILKFLKNSSNDNNQMRDFLLPSICFNYLGQFAPAPANSGIEVTPLSSDITVNMQTELLYWLDINSFIKDNRLFADFTYCPEIINSSKAEELVKNFNSALMKIADHCTLKTDTALTASDFSSTDLDLEQLEDIFNDLEIK